MIILFLWSAFLMAIGLIDYTSKRQIPNDNGDVGIADNNSWFLFTLTITGCHYTILVPNRAKIFLCRYMAALNADANKSFCSFTNMHFVVSILLKMFNSVWLSHLDLISASGPCPKSRQNDGDRLVDKRDTSFNKP